MKCELCNFILLLLYVSVTAASLSLAYTELSIESKKRDEKMKSMDPKKQQQMERLGMATGNLRQVPANNSLVCLSVRPSVRHVPVLCLNVESSMKFIGVMSP